MEDALRRRVIGQDHVVEAISDAVRISRAGLQAPNRPVASMMFLGPTGVGKVGRMVTSSDGARSRGTSRRNFARHLRPSCSMMNRGDCKPSVFLSSCVYADRLHLRININMSEVKEQVYDKAHGILLSSSSTIDTLFLGSSVPRRGTSGLKKGVN